MIGSTMIDRYDIRKILFEDLQHELEQKMMDDFPYLDYLEAEELVGSTLDKIYKEVESRELVLVKDDDLSCMECDYEEACDRLMTVRALAKEGEKYIPSVVDDTNDQDDLANAYGQFEDIIYEVDR